MYDIITLNSQNDFLTLKIKQMKKVLFFIAYIAIAGLFFASCKKAEVPVTPPPVGPADVNVTMLSSEAVASAGKTIISITFEVSASNKDAYLSKKISAFNLDSANAGGIAGVIKVENYQTSFVMAEMGVDVDLLGAVQGATDKSSCFLIKADTKAKMVTRIQIKDTRGISGKATFVVTEFQTFSNLALTEGKIKKNLNLVSKEIIL
jgi:hypothetical protein